MLKEKIQLGDVIILSDGKIYIYLQCPEVGYSMYNYRILLDFNCVNYYGSGLERFDINLRHEMGPKIVKVYRPTTTFTFCDRRSGLKVIDMKKYIKNSVIIFPEENFINISLYV